MTTTMTRNGGEAQLAHLPTSRVDQAREVAEVQAAMVVAKSFPRDVRAALDRISNACTRVALAENAVYAYSRGGQEISGPTIRLAEVLAQCWGNVDFGVRELTQAGGESMVQAYAWDMETNTRQTKTFVVPHERHTRSGVKKLSDPRDIYELVANQAARRLRSCILGVIPGDVQETALEQCEATLNQAVDVTTEGVAKLVATFQERFGVTRDQIETRIQRRVDSIRPAQVVSLRKIFVSLRDGMSAPEDWFPAPEGAKAESATGKPSADDILGTAGQQAPAGTGAVAAEAQAGSEPAQAATQPSDLGEGGAKPLEATVPDVEDDGGGDHGDVSDFDEGDLGDEDGPDVAGDEGDGEHPSGLFG